MVDLDTLSSLCKRRGYMYPGSEIYGGFGGFWDYGPLGVELKRNVKDEWWRSMVQEREDIVGMDSAIVMNPRVWEASGHLKSFIEPLVDCKDCKMRWREDQLETTSCPNCGGELTEARWFNTMFKTFVGPVEDESAVAYLRPETAQGIFVNFRNVLTTSRKKLPFGIAQVGKAFRNEITPGRYFFRSREFEQMELEYFVRPEEGQSQYQDWIARRHQWYLDLGIRGENLRLFEHPQESLAHYSKGTTDVEYKYPFGWGELEGIAYRGDFDLRVHGEHSGEEMTYFDEPTKTHLLPHIVEPSAGVDRSVLCFLLDAYREEPDRSGTRVVLKLDRRLAPIKVGDPSTLAQGASGRARSQDRGRLTRALHDELRRRAEHRPAVPPAGRDRYALLRDNRLRIAGRPRRHHPRTGQHEPGPRLNGPACRDPEGQAVRHRIGVSAECTVS